MVCNYRAFSLPGQFAPLSESANRTLANLLPGTSLPGTFAPWPSHSLANSFPGPSWRFRSLEQKLYGTFVPWNFRSLNVSIAVYFRCRTLAFTPKIKYKIALRQVN